MLAFLFFLTTVAAAVYVIAEINNDGAGLLTDEVDEPEIQPTEPQEDSTEVATIDPFDGPYEINELRFEDEVVGDGEEVQPGDTVTIHYTGALNSDGSIFDSSVDRGEPATFPLDNLIPGWQEGIPGMKVGGKRRLFIPSELGYGSAGSGANIPPNADLIFDIELFETTR